MISFRYIYRSIAYIVHIPSIVDPTYSFTRIFTRSRLMRSPNSQDLTLRLQETMRHILQHYDTPPGENILLTATSYALSHSGKMLRGRMLLEACRAVAGDIEQALCAAVAVEYLHLGTLIHDDIIDQDELRRGSPSVWKQFNPDLALLSGDLLYFAAYQFLACSFAGGESKAVARVL